jgi:hypothetical protein
MNKRIKALYEQANDGGDGYTFDVYLAGKFADLIV